MRIRALPPLLREVLEGNLAGAADKLHALVLVFVGSCGGHLFRRRGSRHPHAVVVVIVIASGRRCLALAGCCPFCLDGSGGRMVGGGGGGGRGLGSGGLGGDGRLVILAGRAKIDGFGRGRHCWATAAKRGETRRRRRWRRRPATAAARVGRRRRLLAAVPTHAVAGCPGARRAARAAPYRHSTITDEETCNQLATRRFAKSISAARVLQSHG